MDRNFVNKVFILGDKISEALSAEYFKDSGDILLSKHGSIALYLYRHSIELQLKSILKRLEINYEHNHNLESLLKTLNKEIKNFNILEEKELNFFNEIILDYIILDEKGTILRYPNNKKLEENLVISDKFIKKNIINDIDNPYLYEIKEFETKYNIDELFKIFFKIHSFIEFKIYEEEEINNYYQSYYFDR